MLGAVPSSAGDALLKGKLNDRSNCRLNILVLAMMVDFKAACTIFAQS